MIHLWKGKNLFILGSLDQRSRSQTKYNFQQRSFPHDNFSSVYWIFNKLGHMIPLWKGKNPIYFGVKGQGHLLYIEFLTSCFHITLVLYIGFLPNLTRWFPCGRGRTYLFWGQRSRSLTINIIFNNGRFRTIILVLYIGSLTNLATWFPYGRGRTLFILGSLGQRSPLL